MRSVLGSLSLLLLTAGCATVSLVPGQAVVEASLSKEQSELRKASDAYIEQAEAEKWVKPSSGLMGFARILVDGNKDDARAIEYTDYIEANTADVALTIDRIAGDIGRAQTGLETVLAEAAQFSVDADYDKKSLRTDVTQFEKALVTAQQSRRSFAKAISVVAKRDASDVKAADTALAEFDHAIDKARQTADWLANAYADLENAPSVS